MGTNFYLIENPCDECGRGDDKLHIGKSSAGWAFTLRLHPEYGIESLEHWVRRFVQKDTRIEDEYGREYDINEMLNCIFRGTARGTVRSHDADFLEHNQAAQDPRGLLRRRGFNSSLPYDTDYTDFA